MECEEETKKCKMTEFFMDELREYKHLHLNIDANKIKPLGSIICGLKYKRITI